MLVDRQRRHLDRSGALLGPEIKRSVPDFSTIFRVKEGERKDSKASHRSTPLDGLGSLKLERLGSD